jgi:hypothetical protein
MNWARRATITFISPLLVACSFNPCGLHAQQSSSAASSGTTGGHKAAVPAQPGTGRAASPGRSSSWIAGKSSFGSGPQNGIWRDGAVSNPSSGAAANSGAGSTVAPERRSALSPLAGGSPSGPAGIPSMRTPASRSIATRGTAHATPVSRPGSSRKIGGTRAAFGSKLPANKKAGSSSRGYGSKRGAGSNFGKAKPAKHKSAERPAIGSYLGSDFGDGRIKTGHEMQP